MCVTYLCEIKNKTVCGLFAKNAVEIDVENKSKAILDGSKASRKQGASNVVLVESSVLSDAKVWNCRFFDSKANGASTLFIILKREMMIKKGVARATGVMRFSIEFYKGWPPLDFHDFCLSATALSRILLALLL